MPPLATVDENREQFITKDGKDCILVNFVKPNHLLIWEEDGKTSFSRNEICKGIHVRNVSVEVLKEIKVWEQLDKKIQEQLITLEKGETAKVHNKMEHARKGRRNKYPNIPKELTCSKCGKVVSISPSITAKKIEKLDIVIDKYVKEYECITCKPGKRGRQANPENAPRELKCKCGYTVNYPMNIIKKTADKKGMSIQDFINGYQCQSCNPTKGRKKGQKIKRIKKSKKGKKNARRKKL